MNQYDKLRKKVESQARRMQQAEKDRPTLFSQTVFIGTLGLLFILPVVLGAYFGLWLDSKVQGYCIQWTVSFIIIGVFIGAINVYLFIRE